MRFAARIGRIAGFQKCWKRNINKYKIATPISSARNDRKKNDDSLHPDGWGDFVFYADGINWVQGVDMLVYPP